MVHAQCFSGCNLSCAFCQNYRKPKGRVGRSTAEALASIFLMLEGRGAHNINLVSPTHFSEKVAEAIRQARNMGLKIPFIYNSNGYESLETCRLWTDL